MHPDGCIPLFLLRLNKFLMSLVIVKHLVVY